MALPRIYFKNNYRATIVNALQQQYGSAITLSDSVNVDESEGGSSFSLYNRLKQIGNLNFDFARGDRVFLTIFDDAGNNEVLILNSFDHYGQQFGLENEFHPRTWPAGSTVEIRVCSQSLDFLRRSAASLARVHELIYAYNQSATYILDFSSIGCTYTNFYGAGGRTYTVPDIDNERFDQYGQVETRIPDGSRYVILDALASGAASTIAPLNGNVTLLKPPGKRLVTTGLGARVEVIKLTDGLWMVTGDLAPL